MVRGTGLGYNNARFHPNPCFSMKFPLLSLLSALLLSALNPGWAASPVHLVFTYMGDSGSSLTANWQWKLSADAPRPATAVVRFDRVSHSEDGSDYAMQTEGEIFSIPGLKDRVLARVQLQGLEPGRTYYLRVGNAEQGFSEEVKVQTIADDDRPLRFVTGGDMGVSNEVRILLRHAAGYAPHFAAIGGDIAYANGKLENVDIWDKWLTFYTEEMVTPEGYSIPMVLAIGNHEVQGSFNQSPEQAPFFFGFFAQEPEKSFFKRQFGPLLTLFVLDSGHVASHVSQVDWLNQELAAAGTVPYRAAIYHVPLYPSHRDFMGFHSDQGREHWAPVFDRHQLTVAFENHDHTFKRSHFIKNGERVGDAEGTLYLGDGCWGKRSPSGGGSAAVVSGETGSGSAFLGGGLYPRRDPLPRGGSAEPGV